jgi:hypothetical protein
MEKYYIWQELLATKSQHEADVFYCENMEEIEDFIAEKSRLEIKD